MEGPVSATRLEDFISERAAFISDYFPETSAEEYHNKMVPELEKLKALSSGQEINLWFEDDLFCQVNLWFVIQMLRKNKVDELYLVRPRVHTRYGFGGLNPVELKDIYHHKIRLSRLDKWVALWTHYAERDLKNLLQIATELNPQYPFLLPAVQAHLDRLPTSESLGRPKETLKRLIVEMGSEDFGALFNAFCEVESEYGYGDLQVRRMINELELGGS